MTAHAVDGEHITPGTTSADEAWERISGLPFVTNVQRVAGRTNMSARFYWGWTQDTKTGGQLRYYDQEQLFTQAPANTVLGLFFTFERSISFPEVREAFGEPSHVLLAAHEDSSLGLAYLFNVVYLDKGFLLQQRVDRGARFDQKPEIHADMLFDHVTLFAPSMEGFDMAIETDFPIRTPSQYLVSWQGIDVDIDTYCRKTRPEVAAQGCQ